MSGGHFDNIEFSISEAAREVHRQILDNVKKNEYGYCNNFSEETLDKMRTCMKTLKQAEAMLTRVDYLICGDDSQKSFHERWEKEVPK